MFRIKDNKPFWESGKHPITGHVVKSVVERKKAERPSKLKKLLKNNWS